MYLGDNKPPTVPAMPAKPKKPHAYRVEFMGDTGAGRHLGSVAGFTAQGVPEQIITAAIRNTISTVEFDTGGGEQQGTETVTVKADELGKQASLYLLKQCPLAMSIGQVVQSTRRPFVWIPDQLPFFARDSKSVKVTCNSSNRISASRVHENVPMFSFDISVTPGMAGAVKNTSASSSKEPALAAEPSSSSSSSSAQKSPPVVSGCRLT